jgi:hypothetical protein
LKQVDTFTEHWKTAGVEVRASQIHIAQLGDKLTAELYRRKAGLVNVEKQLDPCVMSDYL